MTLLQIRKTKHRSAELRWTFASFMQRTCRLQTVTTDVEKHIHHHPTTKTLIRKR